MRRPESASGAAPALGVPGQGEVLRERPSLWEWLTCDAWDDGSPRARGTILVLCDGSQAKLWLNDRSLGRAAWVTGESMDDALDAADQGLAVDSLAWRATDKGSSQKSLRKG